MGRASRQVVTTLPKEQKLPNRLVSAPQVVVVTRPVVATARQVKLRQVTVRQRVVITTSIHWTHQARKVAARKVVALIRTILFVITSSAEVAVTVSI
jgi:hypothetical protein